MKRANISITLLGESYSFSGDPAIIRRAFGLFQEVLEQIQKESRGKDISTHRLGAMTGLALAERLVFFQDRQKKKAGLLSSAQRQTKDLIGVLALKK
jgi:hypothetical protein